MNILSTQKLCKSFAGLTANKDVDFVLPRGQIRALIGPNGAGKSTFVGMLSGRISASSGQIEFQGQNITDMAAYDRIRAGIAYTFQITSVFFGLSLEENIFLSINSKRRSKVKISRSDILQVLDRVGLADYASHKAEDISYGHQRLLEIAMGLAQEPTLFILDEPTQGLSESEVNNFKLLIKNLGENATVLLIEHNMNVVMETAEFITVLDSGCTLAEGTPESIRNNPAVQSAYLGTSGA